MKQQSTVKGVISCEGICLHSGLVSQVKIRPANSGTGIRFIRSDFDDGVCISAHARNVSDTFYSTTLSQGGLHVSTVEHLMAALVGLGVDNAEVLVNGSEVPILDGSAHEWMTIIRQVGIQPLPGAFRPELVIRKPLGVKSMDGWATLQPFDGFGVDCSIDFDHPAIGKQQWDGLIDQETFSRELSSARTFGMLKDVEYLRARGRALGANMSNAIVLDERSVVSPGGLRFPNEFVRHKVLDAIGDLSLIGFPIRGRLVSFRSGHRLHQQLLKVLLDSPDCWELSNGAPCRAPEGQQNIAPTLRLIS